MGDISHSQYTETYVGTFREELASVTHAETKIPLVRFITDLEASGLTCVPGGSETGTRPQRGGGWASVGTILPYANEEYRTGLLNLVTIPSAGPQDDIPIIRWPWVRIV